MALDILLGLSDNAEGLQQLQPCFSPLIKKLVAMLEDISEDVAAKATNCLVNLSADPAAVNVLLEQQSMPTIARTILDASNANKRQLVSQQFGSQAYTLGLAALKCVQGMRRVHGKQSMALFIMHVSLQ